MAATSRPHGAAPHMAPSRGLRRRITVALAVGAGVVDLGAAAVAFGVLPEQSGSVDLLTQANVSITGTSSGKPKPKSKPYRHMREYRVFTICTLCISTHRAAYRRQGFPL